MHFQRERVPEMKPQGMWSSLEMLTLPDGLSIYYNSRSDICFLHIGLVHHQQQWRQNAHYQVIPPKSKVGSGTGVCLRFTRALLRFTSLTVDVIALEAAHLTTNLLVLWYEFVPSETIHAHPPLRFPPKRTLKPLITHTQSYVPQLQCEI
eukprot:2237782-Amphidinium_carterae.1